MTEFKGGNTVLTPMEGEIDPCILSSYKGYGMDTEKGPFLEDVEGKAKELWDPENLLSRHLATELVLGRKVTREEVVDHPELLGHIVRDVTDPERAISALQMLRLIEQQ